MSPRDAAVSSRRILVVEDNDDGRESLRLLLSWLGHRVEVAADGEEGVRKAMEMRPDVALVDINLPRMNGYQVARRLRQALGPSVTLIAHTAYSENPADQRVKDATFDAWLVKPAELSELLLEIKGNGSEPD
jgi:two-component system, sensor histidine kinase